MFSFSEALTYFFKEKKWASKFLFIYIVQLLFLIPATLSSFVNGNSNGLLKNYYYNYNNFDTAHLGLSFIIGVWTLVMLLPYIVVTLWYVYENTQAAIRNRETTAIWENKLDDTLKKAGKYFVTILVYGIMVFVIVVVLAFVFGLIFALLLALFAGLAGVKGSMLGNPMSVAGLSLTTIAVLCCGAILFLALYFVYYLFITPAVLRLFGSNTLSEAFRFKENWELGKKYKKDLWSVLLLTILFGFILVVINIFLEFVIIAVFSNMPALNLISRVIIQAFTLLFTCYFAYIVYPKMLGQLYRNIVKKEKSLHFIHTDEKKD